MHPSVSFLVLWSFELTLNYLRHSVHRQYCLLYVLRFAQTFVRGVLLSFGVSEIWRANTSAAVMQRENLAKSRLQYQNITEIRPSPTPSPIISIFANICYAPGAQNEEPSWVASFRSLHVRRFREFNNPTSPSSCSSSHPFIAELSSIPSISLWRSNKFSI